MEGNKMLKVGLVGVGGISGAHIPAWESMEEAELVALCDVRLEQLEQYAGKRCYTDFNEMLENEDLDILDICLPTDLHVDYSIQAMKKGIHVICEKPISLNKDDVQRVYTTAQENNVKFMVAQVIRFWPEYEYVKSLYDTQKYGKLLSGSMFRLGCIPKWSWDNWMFDENRSGLVPFDLHIHDLDFLVYTFGNPKNIQTHRAKRPEQDFINSVYEYDDFFVETQASWYASPYPFKAQFLFQFEEAIVAYENAKLITYAKDGTISEFHIEDAYDTGNDNVPKSDAYANEIKYFANCVICDAQPNKVTPESLENVLEILSNL